MPSSQSSRSGPTVIGTSIGAIAGLVLGAGIAVYVFGNLQVRGVVRTVSLPTELTQTGATTTVITAFKHEASALTGTGGAANGKYAIGRFRNPSSQTGVILNVCVDVFTAPAPATTASLFINNENQAGSGSARYLIKNMSLTKGTHCWIPGDTNSGSVITNGTVGPDEHLKLSNSQGAGTGASLVGDLVVTYRTRRL